MSGLGEGAMRSPGVVVGLGEVGLPLYQNIVEKDPDVFGVDLDRNLGQVQQEADILNIAIPWSDRFFEIVEGYQKRFKPSFTIIHSTVPIGTTAKIKEAVHSPVLGRHRSIKEEMKRYTKWIGGLNSGKAAVFLSNAGFLCRCVEKSEETEALKLMCLAKYGSYIAFAAYQKYIAEKIGFSFHDVSAWDSDYNQHVQANLRRPLIVPSNDNKIGGHCVLPGTKLLNEQFPTPLLELVLGMK